MTVSRRSRGSSGTVAGSWILDPARSQVRHFLWSVPRLRARSAIGAGQFARRRVPGWVRDICPSLTG